MKSILSALFVPSLLFAALPSTSLAEGEAPKKLEEAQDHFYRELQEIEAHYRKELGDAIAAADRIEVYLLDFVTTDLQGAFGDVDEGGELPITPYKTKKSKILSKAVITPEQRAVLLPALRKAMETEPGGQADCHYPIHGIRAFSGDKIIFQTSICWKCGNYFVDYPNGASFEALGDSAALAAALEKFMPIPQAEKPL